MRALSASSARRHRSLPERLDRCLDRGDLVVLEPAQAVRQPGRAAGAHALEQALALVGQRQPDAAPVVLVPRALDQPRLLEPVDVAGERGRRDSLLGGQLAQAQARIAADQPEERHLPARDPELLGLLAQLAGEAQQHRPQLVGDGERISDNVINH